MLSRKQSELKRNWTLSNGVSEYGSNGETENIVLVNRKSYSLKNDNNGTKRMKRLLVTQLLNNLITQLLLYSRNGMI